MPEEPILAGDLVEILPAARPLGQPAPPRRYGHVLMVEVAGGRAAVQVPDRHYPLQLLLAQLRRVER
jgi:hypothetical protein